MSPQKNKIYPKIYSGDEVPPESGPDRAKSYLYMARIDETQPQPLPVLVSVQPGDKLSNLLAWPSSLSFWHPR
jgi:hypothetical protein